MSVVNSADHLNIPLKQEHQVKRTHPRENKSILDFLGIFDTRRFFYIPTERMDKDDGILEIISKMLRGWNAWKLFLFKAEKKHYVVSDK